MASARALVSELIGDSDESSHEEDDYYDEDCDEYYSPFAAPPPVKPEIVQEVAVEKVESPEPVKKLIEKFFCDVCNAHFPIALERGHEASKKHKGALVDFKIKLAQEKSVIKLREEAAKRKQLFENVFSDKVFVKVKHHYYVIIICVKY